MSISGVISNWTAAVPALVAQTTMPYEEGRALIFGPATIMWTQMDNGNSLNYTISSYVTLASPLDFPTLIIFDTRNGEKGPIMPYTTIIFGVDQALMVIAVEVVTSNFEWFCSPSGQNLPSCATPAFFKCVTTEKHLFTAYISIC